MSLKEDIENAQNKIKVLEQETLATEIYRDYKVTNKRLFIIIIVILIMWFATIGAFAYYFYTTDTEEIVDTVEVDNKDGDARGCIGNKCSNGDINGESKINPNN